MTYKDYCKRYGWIPPIAKLLKRPLLSSQVAEKITDPTGKSIGIHSWFCHHNVLQCQSVRLFGDFFLLFRNK